METEKNLQANKVVEGRVVFFDGTVMICARGNRLFRSHDGGNTWDHWVKFPAGIASEIASKVPALSRLLRKGIHHLCYSGNSGVALIGRESYFVEDHGVRYIGPLVGSRPLHLCCVDGEYFYGEYRTNPERSPVSVWKWQPGQDNWTPAWQFEDVRHVHGVYPDPVTDSIWVTTGDDDDEVIH